MVVRLISVTSAMLVAAALLSACSGTPGADQILALPEAVQRQAHLTCQAEQGINIPEAISVLRLNDGRVIVSVINGPGLSLAQARTINQCASGKLLSGQTPFGSATEPTLVRSADVTPTNQHVRQSTVAIDTPAGCVRGLGKLQRGTLICPGY